MSKIKDAYQAVRILLKLVSWIKVNKGLIQSVIERGKDVADAILDIAEEITALTPTDKDDKLVEKIRERIGLTDEDDKDEESSPSIN